MDARDEDDGYTPARRWQAANSRRGWMNVLATGHLAYHAGPAAGQILKKWKRVLVEFEIDRQTRKPRAVRLTQAQAGQFGYKVRLYGGRRQPWLIIPTSAVGWAARSDPQAIEETVSANEITVSIPFEFKVSGTS